VTTTPMMTPSASAATPTAIMSPVPGPREPALPSGRRPDGGATAGTGPRGPCLPAGRSAWWLASSMLSGPGPCCAGAVAVALLPRFFSAASTPEAGLRDVSAGAGGGGGVPGPPCCGGYAGCGPEPGRTGGALIGASVMVVPSASAEPAAGAPGGTAVGPEAGPAAGTAVGPDDGPAGGSGGAPGGPASPAGAREAGRAGGASTTWIATVRVSASAPAAGGAESGAGGAGGGAVRSAPPGWGVSTQYSHPGGAGGHEGSGTHAESG